MGRLGLTTAAATLMAIVCATGCGADRDDAVPAAPAAVDVVAVGCGRPQERNGVGTVVGDGLVLTARHVVEGPLRRLEVGGRDGRVVADDARLDLALVQVDDGQPGVASGGQPGVAEPGDGQVVLLGPDAAREVAIERTVRLTVVDHTDATEFVRRSHVFAGAVAEGTSGSPLVENGNVVGVVTLAVPGADESHAVAGDEVAAFLADAATDGHDGVTQRTC